MLLFFPERVLFIHKNKIRKKNEEVFVKVFTQRHSCIFSEPSKRDGERERESDILWPPLIFIIFRSIFQQIDSGGLRSRNFLRISLFNNNNNNNNHNLSNASWVFYLLLILVGTHFKDEKSEPGEKFIGKGLLDTKSK